MPRSCEPTISSGSSKPARGRAHASPLGGDDTVVSILDSDGTTLAASASDGDEPGRLLFVSRTAETDRGALTVRVGRSLEDIDESVEIVTLWLLIGVPVLLLVVGGTTWFVVGRALAPVEAIRREVDAISGAELYRRVPQPGSDDEIGRLATTMNLMLDRLEGSQARQRRFISDASHELRSPVASIRQYAEVALAHPGRVPRRASSPRTCSPMICGSSISSTICCS